ncbi:MAG: HEAT repeat domain-containing protein [Chthonomonas sp.]|nr:HEAT repeat domain-containing protein [Chthonomonas sp.]
MTTPWSILAVSSMLASQTQPAARLDLGTYSVGPDKVPVTFPLAGLDGPGGAYAEFGNLRFPLRADGALMGGRMADGGWGEFAKGFSSYRDASEGTITWKTKVFLFTRGELIAKRGPANYSFRRGVIEPFQIETIKESLARLGAMVKGQTFGRINLEFDITVDDDAERMELTNDSGPAFGRAFVTDVLESRLNDYNFQAEDGIYRGPYHGVLCIHAGLSDPVPLMSVRSMPVSAVGYYVRSPLADGDRLALTLYASWIRQLTWRAARSGYALPVITGGIDNPFATHARQFVTDAMWPAIMDLGPLGGTGYLARKYPSGQAAGSWASVADDPYSKLPRFNLESTTNWLKNSPDRVSALLDGASEDVVHDGRRMLVPLQKASAITELAAPQYGLKAMGLVVGRTQAAVLFEAESAVPADASLFAAPNVLARMAQADPTPGLRQDDQKRWVFVGDPSQLLRPVPMPPAFDYVDSLPENIRTEGVLRVEKAMDADRGPILVVSERGLYRGGVVWFAGGMPPVINGAARPVIDFWFRASGRDPFAVQIDFANGRRGWLVLGPPVDVPVGAEERGEVTQSVAVESLNTWQRVRVDLSDMLERVGSSAIRTLAITPQPYYEYFERQLVEPATFEISAIRFDSDKSNLSAPAVPPDADLLSMIQRAGAIEPGTATESDIKLLGDLLEVPNRRGTIAAADVLTRVKAPSLVSGLVSALRSGQPWVSITAAKALANQGTDESWSALRRALEIGPFDHTRLGAIQALSGTKDASYVGAISLAYAAKSWRVRRAAVEALASIQTREASIVAITFLREVEPNVRLAVVRTANAGFDLAARRLLYAAVNDPSEEVRASAAIRLLDAVDEEIKLEAMKVVRDESPTVRRRVLDGLAEKPSPAAHALILQSLGDRVADVRAAALRALTKGPKEVGLDDLSPVLDDRDPRVQLELLELMVARNVPISPALRAAWKTSPAPEVREAARPLP